MLYFSEFQSFYSLFSLFIICLSIQPFLCPQPNCGAAFMRKTELKLHRCVASLATNTIVDTGIGPFVEGILQQLGSMHSELIGSIEKFNAMTALNNEQTE